MAKTTMGTKLPRKLDQKMQMVGEQIRLANQASPNDMMVVTSPMKINTLDAAKLCMFAENSKYSFLFWIVI